MKLPTIKTKRLILRQINMKDAPSIVENINNLDVSRWLLYVPYPYSLKDAKEWVRKNQKKDRDKKREGYTFGIELKAEKRMIGGISMHKVDPFQGKAEVGYWLGARYHRQGYGSEALKAIIDFSFKKLRLRKLEAGVFTGNPSSGKLLEKYGFKKEGLRRKGRRSKADNKIKDERLYGLLKEEYKPGN